MAESRSLASLLIAAAGAIVILVDLLGTAGALAGLGSILAATAATASGRGDRAGPAGTRWWGLLAAGAALVAIGVPLGLVAETPGGLAAAAGAGLVVVAAALGMPGASRAG